MEISKFGEEGVRTPEPIQSEASHYEIEIKNKHSSFSPTLCTLYKKGRKHVNETFSPHFIASICQKPVCQIYSYKAKGRLCKMEATVC